MDYCDEINEIIICVLNDVSDKIKKDLCTREDVNDILLEYTLDIHDIVLDEIMDRIEYYQMLDSVHFFYLSELPRVVRATPRSGPEPRQPFSQAQTRTNNIT